MNNPHNPQALTQLYAAGTACAARHGFDAANLIFIMATLHIEARTLNNAAASGLPGVFAESAREQAETKMQHAAYIGAVMIRHKLIQCNSDELTEEVMHCVKTIDSLQ